MSRSVLPAVGVLPTLQGRRLALRQLSGRDVPALFEVFSDPQVMHYWSHPPLATLADAQWYWANLEAGRRHRTLWQWGIAVRDGDTIVGTVSLFAVDPIRRQAELGYAVGSAYWRRGHASEALHLAITYAWRALDLNRLEADVDVRNLASCRLLEKLGFRHAGERHAGRCVDGKPVPSAFYALQRHASEADSR
jgi:[ribosomal protein S5]-alanine N-acetyltransferase